MSVLHTVHQEALQLFGLGFEEVTSGPKFFLHLIFVLNCSWSVSCDSPGIAQVDDADALAVIAAIAQFDHADGRNLAGLASYS